MGLRDRFFTPKTAKALLSWRIPVAAAVGVVLGLIGVPWVGAIVIGVAFYAGSVLLAMPKQKRATPVDAFALSEPWRQFVQSANRSRQALQATVRGIADGPLKERLGDIVARLEQAVDESGAVATRGDAIDDAVNRIDPVRLRSRLATLREQAGAESGNVAEAIASVESQLASADRLKALSASTADRLRLTQARLDELVARAAEVSVGTKDSATYAHDVDSLVVELEAMRQAVAEVEQASS
ncbi:hypothetical protein [Desertimonas flava]|jgi:hypothetical protein|uniref:hypothetical protein n=1 Tax=Desertimonas flava TaxID=2064846 RepID=UPI000E34CF8E|nr:hypothetical protein [Desertimonas flava]